MTRHALKSLGLSSLFLAGLLSMVSTTACVAPGADSPCEPGDGAESAHGEGACDEEEAEESAGDEAPSGQEDVARPADRAVPAVMVPPQEPDLVHGAVAQRLEQPRQVAGVAVDLDRLARDRAVGRAELRRETAHLPPRR